MKPSLTLFLCILVLQYKTGYSGSLIGNNGASTINKTAFFGSWVTLYGIFFVLMIYYIVNQLLKWRKSKKSGINLLEGGEFIPNEPKENSFLKYFKDVFWDNVNIINIKPPGLVANFFRAIFTKWGYLCSKFSLFILIPGVTISIVLSTCVILPLKTITNPLDLWVNNKSEFGQLITHVRKNYEDRSNYFTFIFEPMNDTSENIINDSNLRDLFDLKDKIYKTSVYIKEIDRVINYHDVCQKRIKQFSDACYTSSILEYFQGSIDNYIGTTDKNKTWSDHLKFCIKNPYVYADSEFFGRQCYSSDKSYIEPSSIGSFNNIETLNISSLIFVYYFDPSSKYFEYAEYLTNEIIKEVKSLDNLKLKLFVDSSFISQNDLKKQSKFDFKTSSLAWLIQFVLVFISFKSVQLFVLKYCLVDALLHAGINILISFLALLSTLGFANIFKITLNNIIIQMLPVLILSIGSENTFYIVYEFGNQLHISKKVAEIPQILGKSLGTVGPFVFFGILIQSISICFGYLMNIPALQKYCSICLVAIFFLFLYQYTIFIPIFAIRMKYEAKFYYPPTPSRIEPTAEEQEENSLFINDKEETEIIKSKPKLLCCTGKKPKFNINGVCIGTGIINFILHPVTKVVFIFLGVSAFFLFGFFAFDLKISADPIIKLPLGSDSSKFINELSTFNLKDRLYFIITSGFDYTNIDNQNMICLSKGCSSESLANQIIRIGNSSVNTHISPAVQSWLDIYLAWLDPKNKCCFQQETSLNNSQNIKDNLPCLGSNSTPGDRPNKEQFDKYLPIFLSDVPNNDCPFGGNPKFRKSVILNNEPSGDESIVRESVITTFHTYLKDDETNVNAMRIAYELAKNESKKIHHKIIPYSNFYISYNPITTISLPISLGYIGVIIVVIIGDLLLFHFNWRFVLPIFLTVLMNFTIFHGFMNLTGLKLTPTVYVNNMIAIGIAHHFLLPVSYRHFLEPNKRNAKLAIGSSMFNNGKMVLMTMQARQFSTMMLSRASTLYFAAYFGKYFNNLYMVTFPISLFFFPVVLYYMATIRKKDHEGEYVQIVEEINEDQRTDRDRMLEESSSIEIEE